MPRATYTSEILPSGPFAAGDIVVFELLDENEVWQWALGKVLCIEPTNERVAQVVPLSCVSAASQFVSDHERQLPNLTGDALMSARDAVKQLATVRRRHEERGDELKGLLLELHKETAATANDRLKVQQTLEDILPALEHAREAVNRISWQDFSEMRSYPTPPPIVKRVLEGVMSLLEDKVPTEAVKWKVVKQYCRGNDFVPRVRDFEGAISEGTSQYIAQQLIQDATFTLQNAERASAAAGPLFEWVTAQARCSRVVRELGPTLAKLEAMDNKMKDNEQRMAALRDEQEGLLGRLQAETKKYQENTLRVDFTMPTAVSGRAGSGDDGGASLDGVAAALRKIPIDHWGPPPNTAARRILYSSIMGKSKTHQPLATTFAHTKDVQGPTTATRAEDGAIPRRSVQSPKPKRALSQKRSSGARHNVQL